MEFNFADISNYSTWNRIEKIEYGWSSDVKYYIEDNQNNKYLLRISTIDALEQKKKEFEIIRKFNTLKFPMSKALDIGLFNNGQNVYMLLSWVEGISLEDAIITLSEQKQYQLGLKAGEFLKSIHSIIVDSTDIPKTTRIQNKLSQLELYEACDFRIKDDENAINFVRNNIQKTCQMPCSYTHGDFHFGNMIYTPDEDIGIIDFNRWKCSDRYEEFYKLQSFGVEISIPFCIGQIHGYFNGKPPKEFWQVQAVYVAHASLYSIKWAERFGQDEIAGMTKRCLDAFKDYDNFKLIIPKWYSGNYEKYTL